jgi:hypothetical protein
MAGRGRDLGDAGAHGAGADHRDDGGGVEGWGLATLIPGELRRALFHEGGTPSA